MTSPGPQPVKILTPEERQQRHRDEMVAAILQTAREIMREEGVGALNLNEVARRLGLTTPALYSYFSNKMAIYDALFQMAIQMFIEGDEAALSAHDTGWERIAAWIEVRLRLSLHYPELYILVFGAPIPGFTPSDENVALTQATLATISRHVSEMVEAGELKLDISIPRAVDLLLALRHGIVAERIGKATVVPSENGRFQHLVADALAMLQAAWATPPHEVAEGAQSAN